MAKITGAAPRQSVPDPVVRGTTRGPSGIPRRPDGGALPSPEAELAVAAEHFALCPDNIYQGAGSIRRYAAGLPGTAIWSFWWN